MTSVFGVFPCIDPDPPDVVLEFRLAPYAATAAATLSLLPNKCSFPAELIDGWSTLKIEKARDVSDWVSNIYFYEKL